MRTIAVLAMVGLAHDAVAATCGTSDHCGSTTDYFCDRSTNTCRPGVALCTGDDAGDAGGGDDWKTAARPVALGQHVSAAICRGVNPPASDEADWYVVDMANPEPFVVEISGGVHQSLIVYQPELGPNYFVVQAPFGSDFTAAIPYEVFVHPRECYGNAECAAPTPTCSEGARCVPGPSCPGDDVRDDGIGDDASAIATPLTLVPGVPRSITGSLCGMSPTFEHGHEADWMVVHAAKGEGLELTLAASAALPYVSIWDANGNPLGHNVTVTAAGEIPGTSIRLTYLPEGDYYVWIHLPEPSPTVTYDVTFLLTSAQVCASQSDCLADNETQAPRRHCQNGACYFSGGPPPSPYTCSTVGRCPGDTWVCRDWVPASTGPQCHPSCPEILGHCAPCVSSDECEGDICIDGECLRPDEIMEPGPAATGTGGGGCAAAGGTQGPITLLLLLGLRRRRNHGTRVQR